MDGEPRLARATTHIASRARNRLFTTPAPTFQREPFHLPAPAPPPTPGVPGLWATCCRGPPAYGTPRCSTGSTRRRLTTVTRHVCLLYRQTPPVARHRPPPHLPWFAVVCTGSRFVRFTRLLLHSPFRVTRRSPRHTVEHCGRQDTATACNTRFSAIDCRRSPPENTLRCLLRTLRTARFRALRA